MEGLLTLLNPDTKVFIPLSRILYIYEDKIIPPFCHIVLEGTDEDLVVLDNLADIQQRIQGK